MLEDEKCALNTRNVFIFLIFTMASSSLGIERAFIYELYGFDEVKVKHSLAGRRFGVKGAIDVNKQRKIMENISGNIQGVRMC